MNPLTLVKEARHEEVLPVALGFAAILASGQALACDDMKGGLGQRRRWATATRRRKAPVTSVRPSTSRAPLAVTSKKSAVKKTAGKPLPQKNVGSGATNKRYAASLKRPAVRGLFRGVSAEPR